MGRSFSVVLLALIASTGVGQFAAAEDPAGPGKTDAVCFGCDENNQCYIRMDGHGWSKGCDIGAVWVGDDNWELICGPDEGAEACFPDDAPSLMLAVAALGSYAPTRGEMAAATTDEFGRIRASCKLHIAGYSTPFSALAQ